MKRLTRIAPLIALCLAGVVQAQDARTIFDKVSLSVVTVKVYDAAGTVDGEGSGVVVGPNEVVTNCHVIEYARSVRVIARNVDERKAIATRRLVESDLCMLRIENLASPPVALRIGAEVVRGERVFAVGNPLGLGLAVSEGLASALTHLGGQPRILTSASISPGSSGGGLFDTQGRLIGITTAIVRFGQNVNVVVPADLISRIRSDGEAVDATPPEPEKDVDWHAIAEKLTSGRQWQALLDHTKRWLDAYPTSLFAAQSMGHAQVNLGQAAEARETLIAVTGKFPRAARAFSYLAYAHMALQEFEAAEAAARRAITLLPGDGHAYTVLAAIELAARRHEDARKSADIAVRLSPALPYAWQIRAEIAAAAEQYAEAIPDLRVAARLLPGNAVLRRNLAAALGATGQTGEARTLMASVGASERNDAKIWGSIGYQELQRRRYADAENAYRRALEIDPEYVGVWTNLALLLKATNRNTEAEQALRTALKLDPANKTALGVLAEIVGTRGEATEAKNLLEKATQRDSGTAREWRALGRSRFSERDYRGAMDAYAKVVELDPKSIDDWIELGNIHGILRQDTEALAALQRAEQLDASNERLLLVLSKFHGDRANYSKSLEFGERAVQKHPASAHAWNSKGLSLLRLMQLKPAIESLVTATRLDPDTVPFWINLGEAHLRAREIARAISALERALKLAPKASDARLFMSQAFASIGQFAIAQKYVDDVLQDEPQLVAAWVNSAMLGVAIGDQAMTLRAYEKLKVLNPQLATALRKHIEAKDDLRRLQFPD